MNAPPLVFGMRTAILLIFALQGLVVAALLLGARSNRAANVALATLLAHLSLSLGPDIIGFAGFYDRWRWLTFAPFDIELLTGPLVWLYVASLLRGRAPDGWRRHLIAPAVELLYRCVAFALPFTAKMWWADNVHFDYVAPALTVGRLVTLSGYVVLAFREYGAYQRWLAGHVSFGADFRLPWITAFLTSAIVIVAASATFWFVDAMIRPLNYYGYYWLHLSLAIVAFPLGFSGWRAADRTYPHPSAEAVAESDLRDRIGSGSEEARRDLSRGSDDSALIAQAQELRERVQRQELWRDALLTLPRLADQLALSPSAVSRLVNQGLGQNFNEFINAMRVEWVRRQLADSANTKSVLSIALDAGFSSKASFNRAFKQHTGTTPSAFRTRGNASGAGSTGN